MKFKKKKKKKKISKSSASHIEMLADMIASYQVTRIYIYIYIDIDKYNIIYIYIGQQFLPKDKSVPNFLLCLSSKYETVTPILIAGARRPSRTHLAGGR